MNDWESNSNPLIDVVDMNSDGIKDIVVVIHEGGLANNETRIYINVNGVFKLATTNLPLGLNTLAIADFNNDGLLDFISFLNGGGTTTDHITFTNRMVLVAGRELITVE